MANKTTKPPAKSQLETKPFTETGRALLAVIVERHHEEMSRALNMIAADIGGASPADGWKHNIPAGRFERLVPPKSEGPQ